MLTQTVVGKLDYGDYSCVLDDGHVVPYFFERKELGDFFGTFSDRMRYERIKREFARAHADTHNLIIVVEGTMNEVIAGHGYSQRDGLSLIRQLNTILWRYGILTLYFSSRSEMAQYIYEFFYSYGKHRLNMEKLRSKEEKKNLTNPT